MALLLGIDESSGEQHATLSGATSNDVSTFVPTAFSTALSFESMAGTLAPALVTALGGALTATSTGTDVIFFSGTQNDVAFSASDGTPVSAQSSGLSTAAGRTIWLYTSGHDNNVLLGREGNADGTASGTGLVAFALYMDTGIAGDAGATSAKLWIAQFEAIHQNDPNDANDFVSLAQDLYVSQSTQLQFSLEGAPSGQNLFLMFGDGTPGPAETEIVVTGKHPADQSSGASITTGDTVNTGQGGGGTTIGTNNQMIDPNEGMYFTFVKGGSVDYTVPALDQNEADIEANIAFDSYLAGARSASFGVVQLQPPKAATLMITAIDNQDTTEKGVTFVDGLGDADDVSVNIDSVTITRMVKSGKGSTEQNYTFTTTSSQAGISVDLSGDTARISGIIAGDRVKYHTAADHNRVLVDNVGDANARLNSSVDIGGFRLESAELATASIGNVAFIDDAPTLGFGNIVGTGTLNPQSGAWSMATGVDGLGATGLDITMTGFQLIKPDSSLAAGTSFAFAETPPSPDGAGSYQFSGSVTGDLDNNPATADLTEHFTLTVKNDGTTSIDLVEGFASTVTESTANGTLGAGGPDAVRTLNVGGDSIVFFAAKPLASAADLISLGTLLGAADYTEGQLETAHPGIIDFAKSLNVSTSGIGNQNNNLQGDANAAITAGDESFVANPGTQFTSAKVFIDNAVTGYDYAHGERLYYRVLFADGTDSGQVLLTSNVASSGHVPAPFTIDGGGKLIDAIELTMATGTVKIPEIQFITTTNNLADGLLMAFDATIHDGDGDAATSSFTAKLAANLPGSAFDYVLNGTAGALDWFNVDLSQSATSYQVNGFDAGAGGDKLVLLASTGASLGFAASGSDTLVTVTEQGGQATHVTVVGAAVQASDVVMM
jgi:hypothetical protein